MMKKVLYVFLVVGVLGLFLLIFAYINQDKLIDRFIEDQVQNASINGKYLEDKEGIRLITVGTSSPLPSNRVQTCNAVFVNGKFFVFDVGDGASNKLDRLDLPIAKLDGIFISHWHSDHFIDLPNLINRSWLYGRQKSLYVYGPDPIDSILQGIKMMLHAEQEFRVEHHGADIMKPGIANAIPISISTEDNSRKIVYQEDGITISTFTVDHDPVSPSLGYRVDYNGLSVVISGDTKKSSNVIEHAKGADILVHEAMQTEFIKRAAILQERSGNTRNQKILNDVVDFHTTPVEAAEVASEAGVKKLILNHLAPVPENPISRRFFLKGMDEVFKGEIILAQDGQEHYIH